ncbi:uncharacterized protein LOC120339333 [Styela clava]
METEDEISQKEKDLAEQLKAVCTPFGDERRSKLKESTDILFEIGKLYLEKAKSSTEMKQKLDFIKCSALLHGARVRYERILYDIKGKKKVHELLVSLDEILFVACKGNKCDKSLFEISSVVAGKFKYLREAEKQDLNSLRIIDENLPENECHQQQLIKIDVIKDLMKKNTKNYISLMNYIAEYCLRILGNSLCPFAIVGLGSLAREEITLYSDFEHVIILEDGIDDSPNYDEVKEYFRWFAVIFEIIIIGLGETIIRSVGVKSINDLYSEDKSKNWFYDMFTPSGIAFDGMVPHSCNTPLGRQEPTKNHKHKVELIQPVSKMASYLTSDEDIKNGYYLKDVLSRTCFVFGNEELYLNFKEKSRHILDGQPKQEIATDILKHVRENVNQGVKSKIRTHISASYELDSKVNFYRPFAVLLGYWARFFKLKEESSFEIIVKSKFNETYHHPTMYGFAVACEARLKLYSRCEGNRKSSENILNYIGKNCAINCISIILHLADSIVNLEKRYIKGELLTHVFPGPSPCPGAFDGSSLSLLSLGFLEEARVKFELEKSLLDEDPWKDRFPYAGVLLPLAITYYQLHDRSEDVNYFRKAEKEIECLLAIDEDSSESFLICTMLLEIYFDSERYEEVLTLVEKWFKKDTVKDKGITFYLRLRQFSAMGLLKKPNEMLNFCLGEISKHEDDVSQLLFQFGSALFYIDLKKDVQGKDILSKLSDSVMQMRGVPKVAVLIFMSFVFRTQMKNDWWGDAFMTLERSRIIQESQMQLVDVAHAGGALVCPDAALCYTIIAKHFMPEAKRPEVLNRVIEICRRPENLVVCVKHYQYALTLMLTLESQNLEVFDIKAFNTALSEAPHVVISDITLQSTALRKELILLDYYQEQISNGKIMDIFPLVISFLHTFNFNLSHPLLSVSINALFISLIDALALLICPGDGQQVINSFNVCFCVERLQVFQIFYDTLMLELKHELNHSSNFFWKKVRSHLTVNKQYIYKLLNLVIKAVSIDKWGQTQKMIEDYANRILITGPSDPIESKYNFAIANYHVCNFPVAAKCLWEVICQVKKGDILHIRAIVTLLFAVILHMRSFGYMVDFGPKYISLCL